MLKLKIIADDIQNLTDARYFAAWGVDYIGFDIDGIGHDSLQLEKIKEIINWIEGPKILAIANNIWDNDTIDFIKQIGFKGIVTNDKNLINSEDLDHIINSDTIVPNLKNSIVILKTSNLSQFDNDLLKSYCQDNEVFLDNDRISTTDLNDIISIGFSGIVLRGGEEDKVGFKSYDDLDEILEYLEN